MGAKPPHKMSAGSNRHVPFRDTLSEAVARCVPPLALVNALIVCKLDETIVVPYSFKITNGELKFFDGTASIRSEIKDQKGIPKTIGAFKIYFARGTPPPSLARELNQLFERSLIYRNFQRDLLQVKIQYLSNSLGSRFYSNKQLPKILSELFPYSFTLFSIQRNLRVDFLFGSKKIAPKDVPSHVAGELKKKNHPMQFQFKRRRAIIYPLAQQFGSIPENVVEYVVVHTSDEIVYSDILNIEAFLLRYYYEKYISRIGHNVTRLQDRLLSETSAPQSLTHTTFRRKLKSFARQAFSTIIDHTLAQSVTLRLFNCYDSKLHVHCERHEPGFDADNKIERAIPAANIEQSVNAFTFMTETLWADGTYLENIRVIPEVYRALGLKGVARHRSKAQCEWCLPLRVGHEVIGTINLESSHYDAFHGFCRDYVLLIRKLIEELVRASLRKNDLDWLSAQGFTTLNIHELTQAINHTEFFTEQQAEFLKSLIVRELPFDKGETYTESELADWVNDWINEEIDSLNCERVRQMIEFNFPRVKFITTRSRFILLYRIITNLIENSVGHGDIGRDKIVLFQDGPRTARGDQEHGVPHAGSNNLRLRYKTYGRFDELSWDQAALSPTQDSDGEFHYGLYFLGLAARVMDGTVVLAQEPLGLESIIELRLRT